MLALAVKGNRYQAERAAESRGISFAVQRESRYGETIGVTAMEHLERVRAWHRENDGDSDAADRCTALLVAAAMSLISCHDFRVISVPADAQCFRPRLHLESYVRPKNYMLRIEPDQIR
jgi:hypothetical protein